MSGRKNSTKQNSLRAPYGTLSVWFYLLYPKNSPLFIKLAEKSIRKAGKLLAGPRGKLGYTIAGTMSSLGTENQPEIQPCCSGYSSWFSAELPARQQFPESSFPYTEKKT